MSRFSLVSVMGGKRTEEDLRPSVVSVISLNRQLTEESKRDLHLFFGPANAKDQPRVIHGERKIQKNSKGIWLASEPLSMDRDSLAKGSPDAVSRVSQLSSGVSNTLSAAGKFLGQKMSQMIPPVPRVNEDSFCDGCGMDPIVGNMYSCSRCTNYSLCESCYQSGIHGFEDSEILKTCREDYALKHVMETCKNRVPEQVFILLMKNVCRGQVDKFKFLANWISDVILGKPVKTLQVRGIEIPHLEVETRGSLVQLLTPVLAERTDIEVCMEWFAPNEDNMELPGSQRRLETLRLWVSTDGDTKSPFSTVVDQDQDVASPGASSRASCGSSIGSPVPGDDDSPATPREPGEPSDASCGSPHLSIGSPVPGDDDSPATPSEAENVAQPPPAPTEVTAEQVEQEVDDTMAQIAELSTRDDKPATDSCASESR